MGLGPADLCNLIRICFRTHLWDHRYISHSHVMIQIEVAHCRLSELAKDAPVLCCQHLLDLQKAADDRGDSVSSGIILEILTQEQEQKKWRHINNTTQPPGEGNPLLVRVQSGPVIETYDTEDEIVRHTSNHLSKCFHLALWHPAIVESYLMTLVSWEIRNALSRSLKALMTSLWIPTFGRRRFCKRHIIRSLICLALRSQLLSQQKISKYSGNGLMKGRHLLLAVSLSHITRLLHQI